MHTFWRLQNLFVESTPFHVNINPSSAVHAEGVHGGNVGEQLTLAGGRAPGKHNARLATLAEGKSRGVHGCGKGAQADAEDVANGNVVANAWVKLHINDIKKLAKSLTYIDTGHSSVSFLELTKNHTNDISQL